MVTESIKMKDSMAGKDETLGNAGFELKIRIG
jgi:hypothetical protein